MVRGQESITAAVHVLQWKSPGPGQPPTEYTGYGIHDGPLGDSFQTVSESRTFVVE
jgi:hypothetical protein